MPELPTDMESTENETRATCTKSKMQSESIPDEMNCDESDKWRKGLLSIGSVSGIKILN